MLAEVGSILVGLALAVVVYTACATFWAIRRADRRWTFPFGLASSGWSERLPHCRPGWGRTGEDEGLP